MKLTIKVKPIVKEFANSEVLDLVNEEQRLNNLETFDSFEEIPEEMIFEALEQSFVLDDIIEDSFIDLEAENTEIIIEK